MKYQFNGDFFSLFKTNFITLSLVFHYYNKSNENDNSNRYWLGYIETKNGLSL